MLFVLPFDNIWFSIVLSQVVGFIIGNVVVGLLVDGYGCVAVSRSVLCGGFGPILKLLVGCWLVVLGYWYVIWVSLRRFYLLFSVERSFRK